MLKFLFIGSLLTSSAFSIPPLLSTHVFQRDGTYPDVAYDVSSTDLAAALNCPNGLNNSRGIILLVHGTGMTGDETWPNSYTMKFFAPVNQAHHVLFSPYNIFLPTQGYQCCWLNIPGKELGDAQTSSEYVAYNIQQLATSSVTGQVVVIGHSQGAGLTIQWALLYWPSTRQLVSRYIAIAGDFHGTDEGPLLCDSEDLYRQGCQAAIIQQSSGSNYLTAQNHRGDQALVPTTSIYTHYDDIIQDENINPTSILSGADNFSVQDLNVCGPLHLADHFSMIVDSAAYEIVKLALGAGSGRTPIHAFNPLYCTYFVEDQLLNLTALPFLLKSDFAAAIQLGTGGNVVHSEPALKQYVCDQGDALQSQCTGSR